MKVVTKRSVWSMSLAICIAGCAAPVVQDSSDTMSVVLAPDGKAHAVDGRGRFREIYCAVNDDHGQELPDYRPCDEALVSVPPMAEADGSPVKLGAQNLSYSIMMVPGLGSDCFAGLVGADGEIKRHVEKLGHRFINVPVEGLSSNSRNARIIRDAVMAESGKDGTGPIILLGYSKGAPDILAALAEYPELEEVVVAVVSGAGAVHGSPLADDSTQSQANLLAHIPGSGCDTSDEGAIEALQPEFRKQWFASHQLPASIAYYSVVTYPDQDHVSRALQGSFKKLAKKDPRNDSQVIFNDQIIPGAILLGFVNADHWAIAVPVARTHAITGSTLLNRNAFPREVLLEAIIRYVDEDLALRAAANVDE